MNRTGPIILIEDDKDDVEIIRTAIDMLNLPNPVEVFSSSQGVVTRLTEQDVNPLLVISDINLPGQHGVDLYMQLMAESDFQAKQTPYVFLSTSPDHAKQASAIAKCGYFVKPRAYLDYVNLIQRIILYWKGAIAK